MNEFSKEIKDKKITFKDKLNNTELVVVHDADKHAYDNIFIDEKFSLKFINYIITELKKSKDIAAIYSLYDSELLENALNDMGLRVANYNFNIYFTNKDYEINGYQISEEFDDDAKKFYADMINKINKVNYKYLSYGDYREHSEKDVNLDFLCRTYYKDGKVVGVVNYEIMPYDPEYVAVNKHFDYNNKVCIRTILSEDKEVLIDMLKDLLNIYKKDMTISITYVERKTLSAIRKMDSKFVCCQYVLIDKKD